MSADDPRADLEGPAKPVRVEPLTLPAPARTPAPSEEPAAPPPVETPDEEPVGV